MGIADALGALIPEASRRSSTQAPKRLRAETPKPLPLLGTAKYNHPDFKPVKVYLRKATRKAAERKWEDADGGDFSDLVEMLLTKFLSA